MGALSRKLRRKQAREWAESNWPAIRAGLVFNLVVGAAVADATPEQKTKLDLLPAFLEKGKSFPELLQFTFAVMGEDWQPGPEWQRQIDSITSEENPA